MKKHKMFLMAAVMFLLAIPMDSFAVISHGPRQTGESVLDELLMSSNRFIISVGSGGCTSKGSFKVDVEKEEGLSSISPHYRLTIMRVKPDECKAIVMGGTLILFDLEKDLGIKGNFTYSLKNHVYSLPGGLSYDFDETLLSVIEKHLSVKPAD